MRTQGAQANKTGNVLEQLVISTLTTHGFILVKYSEYEKNRNKYGNELLLKNAPYGTLYNGKGKTEFLLLSKKYDLCIRIECKWQQTPGSVDEKLPYVYLSAIDAIPEDEVIILIDGSGFRDGAIDWIKKVSSERKYIPADKPKKNIRIMSTAEFLTWSNNSF